MSPKEQRIYTLMRKVVYLLHGGKCFVTGQELKEPGGQHWGHPWEVHHILHQRQHPHLRFDLVNCVPLAKGVHDLDQTGDLKPHIKRKMGDERYMALKLYAVQLPEPMDLDEIERTLKTIMGWVITWMNRSSGDVLYAGSYMIRKTLTSSTVSHARQRLTGPNEGALNATSQRP